MLSSLRLYFCMDEGFVFLKVKVKSLGEVFYEKIELR